MRFRPAPLVALGCALLGALLAPAQAARVSAVAAPVLKWQYGGCAAPQHYCDTGWYASPAVADLDGDSKPEVIWANYDLFVLNGEDGGVQWTAPGSARAWPGIAVADLTGDGSQEIVVGRGADQLTVYNGAGGVVWQRNPFGASAEVRTLAVDDLEQDGQLEIVVGRANDGRNGERETKQVSVYEPDGSVRAGWPARRNGEPGNGANMYNENVAIADLNGDGLKEVFAPTDTHYITALDRNGNQLAANPIYGQGKVWSQVGVHVLQEIDLQGFADCFETPPAPLARRLRPNFANAAPAIADVDGDGTLELIVPGDVYDCDLGDPEGDMYYLPWILKLDRTRWSGSGFDWTVLPAPSPGSGPLSQDYNQIENAVSNAVVADLDGDGRKEILYPSYDGKLHAYWLDKTEHGAWPFDVPGSGIRFASEPAVVDLDNDGQAEVIFTSWPEKQNGLVGQLHVLDSQGNQLYAVDLPAPGAMNPPAWNGGLGAPTIANIDADPDLEVVVGTSHSGVVAYDLPGSANARVLWGTGRGSQKRTGVAPPAPPVLLLSSPQPARSVAPGAAASYTIDVSGLSAPVNLSAGQPSGPAPLPTVSLSKSSLTPPGSATLTLTDKHPAGPLVPGAAYNVTITATSGSNTRTITLHMLVGGTDVYLPAARR